MSGRLRLLDLVKPFLPILPEVEAPLQKVSFDERLIWTVSASLLFFVMTEMPLYGVVSLESADPIYWLRAVFASSRGSLAEIGVLPIITSGFIFQILGGLQLIDVNFDVRTDRELYQSAQKLLAIVLTIAHSLLIVLSGVYGSPTELGASGCILILSQLIMGGFVIILMDEALQKGYGFGSGSSLFTTLTISQQFMWNTLSFAGGDEHVSNVSSTARIATDAATVLANAPAGTSVAAARNKEFTGSFVAFAHMLFSRNFKTALVEAFYRVHLPNLFELYGSIAAFVGIVYLQTIRLDVAIKSTKARMPANTFPVRLLYTGNVPIYVFYSLVANLFLVSSSLYRLFPYNLVVRLLGTWEARQGSKQLFAVSGLAYYLQPPSSLTEALWDPIKSVVYLTLLTLSSILISKSWTEISGASPRDVAKQFKEMGITIVGHRDVSIIKELRRIIPSAAAIGGAISALLIGGLDVLGLSGTGLSMFIGATTIHSYFEILAQEGGQGAFTGF